MVPGLFGGISGVPLRGQAKRVTVSGKKGVGDASTPGVKEVRE